VLRRLAVVAVLALPACLLLASCIGDRSHTPLTSAAEMGDSARLRQLLASGSAPDEVGRHGFTPLVWATRGGHLEAIRTLVREGADPDLPDSGTNGWTPLQHAIHVGQLPAALVLLDEGADPNAADRDGLTPLMMAASYGDSELVRLLLDRGASPAAQSRNGHTALAFAVLGALDIDRLTLGTCQTETVGILLDHSPGLRLKDSRRGRWALRAAKLFGCTEILERLNETTVSMARSPQIASPLSDRRG